MSFKEAKRTFLIPWSGQDFFSSIKNHPDRSQWSYFQKISFIACLEVPPSISSMSFKEAKRTFLTTWWSWEFFSSLIIILTGPKEATSKNSESYLIKKYPISSDWECSSPIGLLRFWMQLSYWPRSKRTFLTPWRSLWLFFLLRESNSLVKIKLHAKF